MRYFQDERLLTARGKCERKTPRDIDVIVRVLKSIYPMPKNKRENLHAKPLQSLLRK